MMKTVGVSSLDNLVDRTVPHSIRLDEVRARKLTFHTRARSEIDEERTERT